MLSQKTSFIKRTGQGARKQFQMLHLAVFPVEVEFLRAVDHETVFYYEKGNQIIGLDSEDPISVENGQKGEKTRMVRIQNTIDFHVYSESNVVYKWSIYKKHPTGSQEYLESCAFNLKDIVFNYILPRKDKSFIGIDDFVGLQLTSKEFRGKFPVTGIILTFALILSNDLPAIREYLQNQYCTLNQPKLQKKITAGQPVIQLTNGNIEEKQVVADWRQDDYSFISASMLSETQQLKNQSKYDSVTKKIDSSDKIENSIEYQVGDLDQLILNQQQKKINKVEAPNSTHKDEQKAIEIKYQHQQKSLENQPPNNGEHIQKKRDMSLLKLDSDQGRKKMQLIDLKLQKQELDLIQEQNNSNKQAFLSKSNTHLLKKRQKKEKKSSVQQQKQTPTKQGFSFKRVIVIFVIISFILIGFTAYHSKSKNKRHKKNI